MKSLFTPKKTFLLLGFIISLQTFAAFIGNTNGDDKDKQISLKNFSRYSHTSAYPSLQLSQFQFKGSANIYQVNANSSMHGQSIIRLQKGNTTYVYPYKYTVKVPLFKTPVAPTLR